MIETTKIWGKMNRLLDLKKKTTEKRKIMYEGKESFSCGKCSEIVKQYNTHHTNLTHSGIKDLTNRRTPTSTDCPKSKEA